MKFFTFVVTTDKFALQTLIANLFKIQSPNIQAIGSGLFLSRHKFRMMLFDQRQLFFSCNDN